MIIISVPLTVKLPAIVIVSLASPIVNALLATFKLATELIVAVSKEVAVTTPVKLTPPVPVIVLELKSKSPPSWGVVSPTISVLIPVREV